MRPSPKNAFRNCNHERLLNVRIWNAVVETIMKKQLFSVLAVLAVLCGSAHTAADAPANAVYPVRETRNMSGWTVHNVNLSGLRVDKANLAGASIVNSRLAGMTIDGIEVTELLACWRAQHQAPDAEVKTA